MTIQLKQEELAEIRANITANLNEAEVIEGDDYFEFCQREFRLLAEHAQLKEDVNQLHLQLAGCGVAAMGVTDPKQVAKPGAYGYSGSYQDTLDLRRKYDALVVEHTLLKEKVNRVRGHARAMLEKIVVLLSE